jgi:hypothetical protein
MTWYADRITVTFEEEPDWAFFKATFFRHCSMQLAYRDLIPNAEMILDRDRGSAEAREVMEQINAEMILDRNRGSAAAREVIEQIPAYLRQRR